MFVENIIGSKAKVKILRVLSESRTAYTLKSIKSETELSLSITHKAAEELAEERILVRIRGNRKERLYKFNTDNPSAHSVFELFRIEKTRQRKEAVLLHTWNVLENVVSKIKNKSNLIILFGSQARGEAILDSDIDILLIPKREEFQQRILDLVREAKPSSKINPAVLSLQSFQSEIKDNTLFYRNLKKDSIILYLDSRAKRDIEKFLEDIQYSA